MTKSVWFWILLFFKLNYTLPLDLSTYNNKLDNQDANKQTQSLYLRNKFKPKTQVSEDKVINLKKVTQEIKEAVYRLEKLRHKENAIPAPTHKTQRAAPKDVNETLVKRDAQKISLNLHDVMEYERLVLSKKNPYAELDDMKLNSLLIAQRKDESKYHPNIPVTADQGLQESLEDGLNIEIVSRGLTGFEIPLKYDTQPQPQPLPPKEKHKGKPKRKQKVCDDSFVDRLKELINEFESKTKRNEVSTFVSTTKK